MIIDPLTIPMVNMDKIGKAEQVPELSASERYLLKWLGEEDFSQYGECHGKDLDALVAKGFAQLHSGREFQTSFIAKGDGEMYQAVSLTDAGRAALSTPEAKS